MNAYQVSSAIYYQVKKIENENLLQIEAKLIMTNALYRLGNYQKATKYLRKIQSRFLDDSMKAKFYYIYSELLLLIIN